jgi:hypothetical protein
MATYTTYLEIEGFKVKIMVCNKQKYIICLDKRFSSLTKLMEWIYSQQCDENHTNYKDNTYYTDKYFKK